MDQQPFPRRRLPIGAEPFGEKTHLRVWAPDHDRVDVEVDGGGTTRLQPEEGGYFSGWFEGGTGTCYRLRLDLAGDLLADPASRFQPEGPFGPSEVIDPSLFGWTDDGWKGVGLERAVLYEMHVGTFTGEGTWAAAAARLPDLAQLGVTVIEAMPVADFPGRFGWGYDGVNLFAPTRLYGRPDDMRAFVDRAHGLGVSVLLDVVYNHFGPDGNVLPRFAGSYLTDRYTCEWGEAVNFDGPDSGPVRELVIANARHWVTEYHLDGLRIDATQQIFDSSDVHIVAAIAGAVREAAPGTVSLLVAENEPQDVALVAPTELGGCGLDAVWNDDFHRSATVALTGRREAYFSDYEGTPQELLSCARHGFLLQGQRSGWQGKRRGTPTHDTDAAAFVNFLQNHDQVANSLRGVRGHRLTSPGRWRALTALLLLMPGTPMLFQGQEFLAPTPFLYFADHRKELAEAVAAGRSTFLSQFPSIAASGGLPRPEEWDTFASCRLDHGLRSRGCHAETLALHEDLLRIRRTDACLGDRENLCVEGAVVAAEAFVLRFFGVREDRLLLVNLGRDIRLAASAQPLFAPLRNGDWRTMWQSEDPRYGGQGAAPFDDMAESVLQGHAATLLASVAPA